MTRSVLEMRKIRNISQIVFVTKSVCFFGLYTGTIDS